MHAPPNDSAGGPSAQGAARHDQHPSKSTEPFSRATVTRGAARVVELAAYRELGGWVAAAEHLNARGLAAAVPASLVARLRRRGLLVWPVSPGRVA